MFICSFFARPNLICSFLLFVTNVYLFIFCSPKKRTKKGRPQIFFGIPIFSAAHALQLVVLRPPQTVMLTKILHFAASKMLICFQKDLTAFEIQLAVFLVPRTAHRTSVPDFHLQILF